MILPLSTCSEEPFVFFSFSSGSSSSSIFTSGTLIFNFSPLQMEIISALLRVSCSKRASASRFSSTRCSINILTALDLDS